MSFIPRLNSNGMWQQRYWYKDSPFYPDYQLPNCTCYSYGRSFELLGKDPGLPTGDGGSWFNAAVSSGRFETGQTPALGAVACYGHATLAGHVGTVEEIYEDGSFLISNSNYARPLADYPPSMPDYFFTSKCDAVTKLPDWLGPSFKFQGFIYILGDIPPQPPVGYKKKMPLYMMLRRKDKIWQY